MGLNMNIRDDGKNTTITNPDALGNTITSKDMNDMQGAGNNLPSSDIRKIKLNYIQLNKRATTASNGMSRKIPQKG